MDSGEQAKGATPKARSFFEWVSYGCPAQGAASPPPSEAAFGWMHLFFLDVAGFIYKLF
jgi:hypothetical protein